MEEGHYFNNQDILAEYVLSQPWNSRHHFPFPSSCSNLSLTIRAPEPLPWKPRLQGLVAVPRAPQHPGLPALTCRLRGIISLPWAPGTQQVLQGYLHTCLFSHGVLGAVASSLTHQPHQCGGHWRNGGWINKCFREWIFNPSTNIRLYQQPCFFYTLIGDMELTGQQVRDLNKHLGRGGLLCKIKSDLPCSIVRRKYELQVGKGRSITPPPPPLQLFCSSNTLSLFKLMVKERIHSFFRLKRLQEKGGSAAEKQHDITVFFKTPPALPSSS